MKIFMTYRPSISLATDSSNGYALVVAETADQAKHMVDSTGLVEVWELGVAHMGLSVGPLFEYEDFVLSGPNHELHRDRLDGLGKSRKRWVQTDPAPQEIPSSEVARIMSIQTEWG